MKWILRYILNTIDVGLIFERDDNLGQCIVGYVDSDYAGDLDKCGQLLVMCLLLQKHQ